MFVLEVEPLQTGVVYPNLPLHCTILHWFRTREKAATILKKAGPVIQNTPPIELIAGKTALFGPSQGPKDVQVNLVKSTPALRLLHDNLRVIADRLRAEHTEPYIGESFHPHVTQQGKNSFSQGSRHLSTVTYLVEALNAPNLTQKFVSAKIMHQT